MVIVAVLADTEDEDYTEDTLSNLAAHACPVPATMACLRQEMCTCIPSRKYASSIHHYHCFFVYIICIVAHWMILPHM